MTQLSLWTLMTYAASFLFIIFAVTRVSAAMRTVGEDRSSRLMIEYLRKN